MLDLLGRGRDQRLDLLGGLGRALGQRPHLGGHHREAAAGVAGPRRLDAGVQRQQVGLEGDLVDHADDLADLAGTIARSPPMASTGLAHHLRPSARRRPWRATTTSRAWLGALGGLAHRGGDLVERRGGLLQAGRLLLGAPGQVVGAPG